MWAKTKRPSTNKNTSHGFTIVELLIVIVVIAILAAITVVAFNGIQNRAYDTTVKTDLSNAAKKIQFEAAANDGTYLMPTASTGIKASKSAYATVQNTFYFCRNETTNQFALAARSRSGKTFKYVSGSVTENATAMYGADTCAQIDLQTWSGTYGYVGYDQATGNWASWVN